MNKDLYSIKLSPEFVKEFNELPAEDQSTTLTLIRSVMRDPCRGHLIDKDSIVEFEQLTKAEG